MGTYLYSNMCCSRHLGGHFCSRYNNIPIMFLVRLHMWIVWFWEFSVSFVQNGCAHMRALSVLHLRIFVGFQIEIWLFEEFAEERGCDDCKELLRGDCLRCVMCEKLHLTPLAVEFWRLHVQFNNQFNQVNKSPEHILTNFQVTGTSLELNVSEILKKHYSGEVGFMIVS